MPAPADGFIGLAADQNETVEALRRYAEFWKIPNKPVNKIPSTDVDTIFCSGRSEQAFDGKKVVISPSGAEMRVRMEQVTVLLGPRGFVMLTFRFSPDDQV